MSRRGFTFIELLVVVIVLGILASLALPQFVTTVDKRYQREAKDTLYELLAADGAYRQEHGAYTTVITGLPMQNPNRGGSYPLAYSLAAPGAGTTAGIFRAQATYGRLTPPATSDVTYDSAAVPPAAPGCLCESGWPVNDCPAGPCP